MDRPAHVTGDRAQAVERLTEDVEHPPEDTLAYRHGDGRTTVDCFESSSQSLGWTHGDTPNPVIAELLLDLDDQVDASGDDHLDRVVHLRGESRRKRYIDHRSEHLHHFSARPILHGSGFLCESCGGAAGEKVHKL